MPVEVYHNLIEAVHEDIGILHRYMRLRKKLMKTDELHMYDLYTSLVADADVKIPFEKSGRRKCWMRLPFSEKSTGKC